MKASDMSSTGNTSFLFKGSPGNWKTCAAASFAISGPVYLAYFDKNKPVELLHYFNKIIKRPELLDNVDYEVFGAHNANEYLNKLWGFTRDCKYTAIITDSLTSLTGAAVNWSMGFRDPKGPQKDKLNPDSLKLIPDFDEYKVETSLIVQAIDVSLTLPCHIIWTAHPLPQLRVESVGAKVNVSKSNSLVTYGSKVAGLVPGRFTEIYNFGRSVDYSSGAAVVRGIVNTSGLGDEIAKTTLGLPAELDITNRPFYEVWKEALDNLNKGE